MTDAGRLLRELIDHLMLEASHSAENLDRATTDMSTWGCIRYAAGVLYAMKQIEAVLPLLDQQAQELANARLDYVLLSDDYRQLTIDVEHLSAKTRELQLVAEHSPECAVRSTRDGWDATCDCKGLKTKAEAAKAACQTLIADIRKPLAQLLKWPELSPVFRLALEIENRLPKLDALAAVQAQRGTINDVP